MIYINWFISLAVSHNTSILYIFSYLCRMKRLIIKLAALGMVIIFLGHVSGMRVSEHTCFECKTKQVEIGNHFSTFHLTISLNKDHSHCCDVFHHQHQDHSNTCSHSILSYTVPFKAMEKTGQNLRNPLTFFLFREMSLLRISAEKPGFLNTSISQNPVSGNILLKTCRYLT